MDPRFIPPYLQQQLWAEEVLYLHSLWHQGPPPNPRPNPNLRPFDSTKFKKSNKNKKKKWINLQSQSQIEWPVNPSTEPTASPSGWPDPPPYPTAPPVLSPAEQARASALFLQKSALKSCREFLLKDGSDVDDDEEEEEAEAEAFVFFLAALRKDEELRGYYMRNWEKGEFFCLVCGGIGVKLGKKYGDCVGLVQHSRAISKTKRRGAHRGFGRAVCSVLGWDINRLPSVNVGLGEGMVQTQAKEVVMQVNDADEHSYISVSYLLNK